MTTFTSEDRLAALRGTIPNTIAGACELLKLEATTKPFGPDLTIWDAIRILNGVNCGRQASD